LIGQRWSDETINRDKTGIKRTPCLWLNGGASCSDTWFYGF